MTLAETMVLYFTAAASIGGLIIGALAYCLEQHITVEIRCVN